MELLQYWNMIRKRLWLLWLFGILALVGAGYYVLSQPAPVSHQHNSCPQPLSTEFGGDR